MQIAQISKEKLTVPKCRYPLPPYLFRGRGITLIYEIPFVRVQSVLPDFLSPDPSSQKIWFMVNFYDWREFRPVDDPKYQHSFLECYYKLSVKYRSELGDYPVKLYLNSDVGIASGIELYGYPKYRAEMGIELDEERGRFHIARGHVSELSLEIERSTGLLAAFSTSLANLVAASYIKKYTGNYLYDDEKRRLKKGPTRIASIRYEVARLKQTNLREPVEWGILTQAETREPKYCFILEDIEAILEKPTEVPTD